MSPKKLTYLFIVTTLAPVKGDLPKVKIGNNQELVFPETLHHFCLQGEQRYGNKYTVGQEQQIGS